jgi:hypothetical protein
LMNKLFNSLTISTSDGYCLSWPYHFFNWSNRCPNSKSVIVS